MKVITFGELMLRLNPPGYQRIIQTNSFDITYGGAEANVAVSLCSLGAESEFVSKMPANDIAQSAINNLRHWGVGTDRIVRGGDRLGVYYLEKGASQRPSKVIYDRAHSAIAEAVPGDFDWDRIFEDADWFHLTGITPALSENLVEICLQACRTAKERGITVSFDPNYRAKLWTVERAAEVMQVILPYVDVLITNENQAADLFGIQVPEGEVSGDDVTDKGYLFLAKELMKRYALSRVALTERRTFAAEDNSFCAKLYDGDCLYSSVKYRIDIVDRVGGGDSFAAGLIYALREGYSTQDAVSFAAANSCLKHSMEGDFNSATVQEVLALAKGNANGRVLR